MCPFQPYPTINTDYNEQLTRNRLQIRDEAVKKIITGAARYVIDICQEWSIDEMWQSMKNDVLSVAMKACWGWSESDQAEIRLLPHCAIRVTFSVEWTTDGDLTLKQILIIRAQYRSYILVMHYWYTLFHKHAIKKKSNQIRWSLRVLSKHKSGRIS